MFGEAVVGRLGVRPVVEVVAERHRRQPLAGLPGRAEGRRPGVTAVEAPALVGALERAVAEAAEEHVLSDAQDGEVEVPVPVDVERVGAGHVDEIGTPGWEPA